jgi:hypothetical protein
VAPRSAFKPTIRGRDAELVVLGEQLDRVRSGSGAVLLRVAIQAADRVEPLILDPPPPDGCVGGVEFALVKVRMGLQ